MREYCVTSGLVYVFILDMRRKVTLKDIARELDVSISTVSKALKNSTEISRDTREKIQASATMMALKHLITVLERPA